MKKKQVKNDMMVAKEFGVEEKLKRIFDLFFGMNPRNKFWLLEVLLLAKRGELFITYNAVEKGDLILCDVDTSLLAVTGGTENKLKDWSERGISVEYGVGRTTEKIRKLFLEIDMAFTDNTRSIGNVFSVKQMEPLDLMEIIHILCSLPSDWYLSEVGKFTEEILSYIARNGGKVSSFGFQPIQVTRLVMNLLDVEGGSVYNPYAGVASYGTFLDEKVEYHAQEITPLHLIARLNLLLHGNDDRYCVQGDSVSEWESQPVDYIVASPPFNAPVGGRKHDTLEADFFAKAYKQANKKVAAVVSGHFCALTSGNSFAIRKTIIEKDLLESVIRLPNDLLYGTNIPGFIVVLNKEKEQKGKVKFYDASECFKKQAYRNILDDSMVISLLDQEDKEHSAIVDNSMIFANGCSFIPERYIAKLLIESKDGERYIALEHILTSCSRQNIKLGKGQYHIVTFPFPDLQFTVKSGDLAKKDVNPNVPTCEIKEDCIIIDTLRQLRSVYVVLDGTPAYHMPYYGAFKVDTSVVIPEYLVIQLRQPYMAKQIITHGTGTVVNLPGRSLELMAAKVFLPTLEEQKAAIMQYKEQLLQEKGVQLDDLYRKRLEDFVITQRERKHAVSQVLDDILPAIEVVGDFIHLHESFSKDSVVSRRGGATLEEYISKLSSNVKKVTDMVKHFTDSDKFHAPVPLNLEKSISSYLNKKITKGYEVVLEYLEEGEMIVNAAEEDLHQVFDNLIKNAEKYGFVDKTRYDYKVKITVSSSEDGRKAIMLVRNNGVPVSKDFDVRKIFAWGEGHGTGIGCNQVKQIVEHFGGTVSYHEMGDDPDGFVCVFEIVLPLNN